MEIEDVCVEMVEQSDDVPELEPCGQNSCEISTDTAPPANVSEAPPANVSEDSQDNIGELSQDTINDILSQAYKDTPVECNKAPQANTPSMADLREKYGFKEPNQDDEEEQEYLTPYESTVIYMDDQYFEVTAAAVASRAQRVPMIQNADRDAIIDIIGYLTPKLTIMGSYFSREQIQQFFARGFQHVNIFMYNNTEAAKYLDKNPEGPMEPFHKNVHLFGLEELYDVLSITGGMINMIIMEKMTMIRFPGYNNPNMNHNDCLNLQVGIQSTGRPFGDVISEIISSWKGFEIENEYTLRGKILLELKKQIVTDRINKCGNPITITEPTDNESKSYLACAVPCTEFVTEVKLAIPKHKDKTGANYQVGILYRFEIKLIDEKPVNGYWIGMSSMQGSGINVYSLLKYFLKENIIGSENDASGWMPSTSIHKILPFL